MIVIDHEDEIFNDKNKLITTNTKTTLEHRTAKKRHFAIGHPFFYTIN